MTQQDQDLTPQNLKKKFLNVVQDKGPQYLSIHNTKKGRKKGRVYSSAAVPACQVCGHEFDPPYQEKRGVGVKNNKFV